MLRRKGKYVRVQAFAGFAWQMCLRAKYSALCIMHAVFMQRIQWNIIPAEPKGRARDAQNRLFIKNVHFNFNRFSFVLL